MENYIVINGKKAELTPEQLKALGIEVEKHNPFTQELHEGEIAYYISETGTLGANCNAKSTHSDMIYSVANYCTDRNLMQQRAYNEILNRLLWRYSMEHDGDKCANKTRRYYIYYSEVDKKWDISYLNGTYSPGRIYFISHQVAENAIKEIIKPFMEEHPDFKW